VSAPLGLLGAPCQAFSVSNAYKLQSLQLETLKSYADGHPYTECCDAEKAQDLRRSRNRLASDLNRWNVNDWQTDDGSWGRRLLGQQETFAGRVAAWYGHEEAFLGELYELSASVEAVSDGYFDAQEPVFSFFSKSSGDSTIPPMSCSLCPRHPLGPT